MARNSVSAVNMSVIHCWYCETY